MVCVAREQRSVVRSIREKQGRLGGCVCERYCERVEEIQGTFGLYLSPEDYLHEKRKTHPFLSQPTYGQSYTFTNYRFLRLYRLSRVFSFSAVKPPEEDITAEENELAD